MIRAAHGLGVALGLVAALGGRAQAPAPDSVALAGEIELGVGDSLLPAAPAPDTLSLAYTPDSLASPRYIARQMRYSTRYDFLDYGRNYLQWANRGVVAPLFEKLKRAGHERVKIVHIGDSHVQADMYPGTARNYLMRVFGRGGRGFLFPYRAAGTHAPYDYFSYSSGLWVYDRNLRPENGFPLGLHGATVRTTDSTASLRFIFNEWAMGPQGQILKIYCRRDSLAFDLRVEPEGGAPLWVTLQPQRADSLPYVALTLPPGVRDFTVRMLPRDTARRFFECYGLALETPADTGLTYYSAGINGATFSAVLNQNLMPAQLRELAPDLVILDVSGNEYYGRPFKPAEFDEKLTTWVRIVQRASPGAAILISCSQDIYYGRRYHIAATEPASAVARQVALREGCAFYDWYRVAGGEKSMDQWAAHRLAKRDKVHLTYEGYRLKGELLANALLTAYYQYLTGSSELLDSTQLAVTESALERAPVAEKRPLSPAETGEAPARASNIPKGYTRITYIVRSGDVLGSIAERYQVGVSQLRAWNGLRSHLIYPGQKLAIYLPERSPLAKATPTVKKPTTTQATPKTTHTPKPTAKGRLTYTVKAGDSLWLIAQKYGTTVAAIKSLNGLKSDSLRPGQHLQIP